MTLNYERYYAVLRTEEFLKDLCNSKVTPRVPTEVRKQARDLLRHYPTLYDMERASEQAHDIFGNTWRPPE